MEGYSDLDLLLLGSGPTAPRRCAICPQKSGLLLCSGCKVVDYCGTEHQTTHRPKHKTDCRAIKVAREKMEREKDALQRAEIFGHGPSDDVFTTSVGRFWGIIETRDYMRARCDAAHALLKIDTKRAVEGALDHFNDMIRLCRNDNLGVRDIIPHLMLRLGQDQECYNFLKWWATTDKPWDISTPYLRIGRANPCERNLFSSKEMSLSHLVALTLLKLRLYMDLEACANIDPSDFFSPGPDLSRPIGSYVRTLTKSMDLYAVERLAGIQNTQYKALCQQVFDENPYFWELLVGGETPPLPPYYSPGSMEEAQVVLRQCQSAWNESEDAIIMINADTADFVTVYQGPTTDPGGRDPPSTGGGSFQAWERNRGTGRSFPSRFEARSSPTDLFVPSVTASSNATRFLHRNDPRKVLVFVDGACSNNGQQSPRAGWAVVLGEPNDNRESSVVSGRLENKGPFGGFNKATSNRAELRAAIAALRLCDWRAEGYVNLVIATDSSYVVDGATGWVKGWVKNGWTTHIGDDVKNKDLWELLLGEAERWIDKGLVVEFWKIPRELNQEADQAAKETSQNDPAVEDFKDVTLSSGQRHAHKPQGHILALCLENEALFDSVFGTLVSRITAKSKMERARTPEAALAMLDQEPRPSVILVTDGSLARQRKLWERIIDHLRDGATVILAGMFSSMVNEGEFNRFFARLGLPWKR
ncbi:unnamed protein product [Clonostachys rosea]|uniref:ribonuclease H n=1 Tax=Bionectria ochroleuca TaxID=29856 RepID=A0ABY6V1I8_BIOOC|nr:unnamed protein product [Clonostachys rosea]